MKILGFQKTTLLDYPQKLAATIFLGGCNFRCPFCHNASLVNDFNTTPLDIKSIDNVLQKRQHILEGICITGGEPTLQKDLPEFIAHIKSYGYLVKLDTNGSNPAMLNQLIHGKLIDYVAMDIKNSILHYENTAGTTIDIKSIQESVSILKESAIDYEFRTTVVKELHHVDDFISLGKWLQGSKLYFLQNFISSPNMVSTNHFSSYSREELTQFQRILQPYIQSVQLRGI